MSAAEIAEMILALEAPHPLRIGIDGFCAAGKTTLANAVAERLEVKERRVIRASADNFQNPPEVRWQMGPRSPEGFFRHAIDFQALRSELLEPVGPTGSRQYRTSTYDIRALRPNLSPQQVAASSAIFLLDGLFLHSPQLEGCLSGAIRAGFRAVRRRTGPRSTSVVGLSDVGVLNTPLPISRMKRTSFARRSRTRQLTKLDQNPGIPATLDDILIRDPDV